ncbi:MAG: hypothetical protein R8K21_07945 [Mariprofundales bacterium]
MALLSVFAKKKRFDPHSSPIPLQVGKFAGIYLDEFSRGIDNVRVDVCLSTQLTSSLQRLIQETIKSILFDAPKAKYWNERMPQQNTNEINRLRKNYHNLMESTFHRAKQESNLNLIELARLAVTQFCIQQTHQEIEERSVNIKELLAKRDQKDKTGAELHAQIVWLVKYQQRLAFHLVSMLFSHINAVESSSLNKIRLSLFLNQAEFHVDVFHTPLLCNDIPDDAITLMQHYLLPPRQGDEKNAFEVFNAYIDKMLDEYAPVKDLATHRFHLGKLDISHQFFPEMAQKEISIDWKDEPTNMLLLFEVLSDEAQERKQRAAKNEAHKQVLVQQAAFQAEQFDRLYKDMKDNHWLLPIINSYISAALAKSYGGALSPHILYDYIADGKNSKHAARTIENAARAGETAIDLDKLKEYVRQHRNTAKEEVKKHLIRCMHDIISYRRSLKYYFIIKAAINTIHVLKHNDEIQLSRSNNTLYDFNANAAKKIKSVARSSSDSIDAGIKRHVILKADVRGSVGMTADLRKRNLNPATHFSRNFFDPISALIARYNANKVFIEGDAIILSIFEYENASDEWLAVARACGLAKDMIEVVRRQHDENLKHELPVLELGIGITMMDEPPTFLFDGKHRITISPAIGRSDRLSSCSKVIRKILDASQIPRIHQTEFFALSADDSVQNDKGEVHLLYNVNGIALDFPAFEKLKDEIALKSMKMRPMLGEEQASIYHIGIYPDGKGHVQRLVVRQSLIRLWDPKKTKGWKPTKDSYYEVVADPQRLKLIDRLIRSRGI